MRLFIITILTVVFSWQAAMAAPPVVKDTKNETASPKTTVPPPPPPPENYTAAPPSADAPSGEPEPEVNITTKGTETHAEYRVNGRLYSKQFPLEQPLVKLPGRHRNIAMTQGVQSVRTTPRSRPNDPRHPAEPHQQPAARIPTRALRLSDPVRQIEPSMRRLHAERPLRNEF